MKNTKLHLLLQIALLLAGTIIAWYTTINNFLRFYHFEGTIFKIQNCVIPNPATGACFYGAIGFLIALIWSIIIYRKSFYTNTSKLQHYLWWFVSAGAIFAWFTAGREIAKFYTTPIVVGCSGSPIVNPFTTPCFFGASIFLVTAILAGITYYKISKI